jgi:hypothetical protein
MKRLKAWPSAQKKAIWDTSCHLPGRKRPTPRRSR